MTNEKLIRELQDQNQSLKDIANGWAGLYDRNIVEIANLKLEIKALENRIKAAEKYVANFPDPSISTLLCLLKGI
jgi:phage shock protein A